MNHQDHVRLLQHGVLQKGGLWADLGSGQGAFTLALAELIGEQATIYSVDKDRWALRRQRKLMRQRFPHVTLHTQVADFTKPLSLPLLDGLVMANSLHFVRDKRPLLIQLRRYLKPNGSLLIVEYNVDRGNMWVPYPFSYATWQTLAAEAGFTYTEKLATQPSRFLGEMFSAVSS